MDMLNAQNI
ncbi:hypothetical protein BpHYR1_032586 [Brachionus plicatilis]|uniref:Uncharacterized protein n=1 Tax=Brachionus plicatilis TaxID=10195 RepID=A0A3M7PYT1_BRAPC|nr:hypothetical protein BpHYR1_032586 [Brachionus plicatilis]